MKEAIYRQKCSKDAPLILSDSSDDRILATMDPPVQFSISLAENQANLLPFLTTAASFGNMLNTTVGAEGNISHCLDIIAALSILSCDPFTFDRAHVKSNPVIMDNIVLDDRVPSQNTSNLGSQAAAQVLMFPSEEMVLVKSGPKPDIWETHRSTIKRLYLDDNKTLKDVMAIMERDYDHKATVKMYKSRINKWGLDKNCKAKEMKAIARKKVERDAIGKASLFQIRGRQVDIEEVLRHFKRKRYQSLEEMVARDKSPEARTPSDIDCLTPGASIPSLESNDARLGSSVSVTVAEAKLVRSRTHSPQTLRSHRRKTDHRAPSPAVVRRRLLSMNENLHRLSSLIRVSPSLEPPRDLLVPELMFSAIKTFLRSSLDGGFWSTNERGCLAPRQPISNAIYDFDVYCHAATVLLRRRLFVEARQLLFKACEKSVDVVEEGHPQTTNIMLKVFLRLKHAGYGDAAIKVFEHLRSTARMTPSSTPAFCLFIENMLLLDQNVEEAYSTAWKCSRSIIEQHVEPFSSDWLDSRLSNISSTHSTSNRQAEMPLRSLSTECEQKFGKSDTRYWGILCTLAWNLSFQEEFQEAEEVGLDILQHVKAHKHKDFIGFWIMEALDVVSRAQYNQGKYDLAEDSLRHCINIAAQDRGEKDPLVIQHSLELEHWLLGWGRQEEALALAARRTQLLGPPEIEELIE